MVSEHGWDYNTVSGPPLSWDHGKDAMSYYHVMGWLDLIAKSDTAIGNAELQNLAGGSMTDPGAADAQIEGHSSVAPAPGNESPETGPNTFVILGHEDEVKEVKKVSGARDGWMTEDTTPGVEGGRIWRGVRTFRVPNLREIKISEEPRVGSESGPPSRGGYRGRRSGGGNYQGGSRGRGNMRGTNHGASGGVSAERWAATRGW